ncbi:MAG: hypothetical protein KGZ72_02225 [Roseovarius sp.]|jgi:ribosomal protein S18 acetylase RimI-like enzyme|nr:hypothetical protein [Roseovarius sp.]
MPPAGYLRGLDGYIRRHALTDSNSRPAKDDHTLLLLEDEDLDPSLIGVLSLGRRADGNGWHIDLAAIASEHQGGATDRGQPFSTALLAAAYEHIRRREITNPDAAPTVRVTGSVHRDNGRARAVLERNGFIGFIQDPNLPGHLIAACDIATAPGTST